MDCNSYDKKKFDNIAPFYDHEVKQAIQELLADPGLKHAVNYIIPNVNWDEFSAEMMSYKTIKDFQTHIIYNSVSALGRRVTTSVNSEGWEKINRAQEHVFMSNHRDIILDAGFLNILRHDHGFDTTEIAIGDNLLIQPWIRTLVRLNKSFIVQRGVSMRQKLIASKELSEYIHYCICCKKESVWIAQREGRAKDSNDRTQESLLKMLALAPDKGDFIDNIKELNIIPLSISYEYDPCDYLKAKEFQQKRDNPDFKKTQRDDLLNMETGILGFKGNVMFRFGNCINEQIENIIEPDKRLIVDHVARIIDKEIHSNYEMYPCNYIAHDLLNNENRFADKYSDQDVDKFKSYLDNQIKKIDEITPDYEFIWHKMLEMYSNILTNHLESIK